MCFYKNACRLKMTTKFQIDILSAMPVNTRATQFLCTQKKNRIGNWNSKEGSLNLTQHQSQKVYFDLDQR